VQKLNKVSAFCADASAHKPAKADSIIGFLITSCGSSSQSLSRIICLQTKQSFT